MIQHVKLLATKFDELSFISGIHMTQGESQLPRLISDYTTTHKWITTKNKSKSLSAALFLSSICRISISYSLEKRSVVWQHTDLIWFEKMGGWNSFWMSQKNTRCGKALSLCSFKYSLWEYIIWGVSTTPCF